MSSWKQRRACFSLRDGTEPQPTTPILSLCRSWLFGQSLFPFNEALGEKRCVQAEDVENPGCAELHSGCASISLLASCRAAAVSLSHPWNRAQSLLCHGHKANISEYGRRG